MDVVKTAEMNREKCEQEAGAAQNDQPQNHNLPGSRADIVAVPPREPGQGDRRLSDHPYDRRVADYEAR